VLTTRLSGGALAAYLTFPLFKPMEQNANPTAEQVARQFAVENLDPRTEIWSKDVERASPSVGGYASE
jgi:hypothetical protein